MMFQSRRSILKMGGALIAMAALPLRALANFVRNDAAFTATGMDDTFAALGAEPMDSTDIVVGSPDIAENGSVVPVEISTTIPGATRIMIMVEKNPNPLSAVFEIPEGTKAAVATRVKVSQTCQVYGVVEANGKFYKASKETKVTLGGCGG